MQKLLCYIDPLSTAASDVDSTPSSIRAALHRAISMRLEPVGLPPSAERRAIDMEPVLIEQLRAIGDRLTLAPGRVAGGLLRALMRNVEDEALSRKSVAGLPLPNVDGLTRAQVSVLEEMEPHLRAGRWVLCEAGTGSGKSRVIAHAAEQVLALRDAGFTFPRVLLQPDEMAAKPLSEKSPARVGLLKWRKRIADRQAAHGSDANAPLTTRCVIIAAPTVANVMHLVRERDQVIKTIDPLESRLVGVALGRGQFVSASAVEELLLNQEVPDAAVAEWYEAGMPAGKTSTTARLAVMYPGINGLLDDLKSVATDFPVLDAILRPDHSDDDAQWYYAMREMSHGCDILYVTHAMLAHDSLSIMRLRQTALPSPLALFIDEAHVYEEAAAAAQSSDLALSHTLAILRTGPWAAIRAVAAANTAADACAAAMHALRRVSSETAFPANIMSSSGAASAWNGALPALDWLQATLTLLEKSCAKATPAQQAIVGRHASAIHFALSALRMISRGLPGRLSFSPKRRYPHLSVGPRNVDQALAVRWDSTPSGALLSGTLLTPSPSGPKVAPIIRRLALPAESTVATRPIHPHWLKSTPVVYTPSRKVPGLLVPPSGTSATEVETALWINALGDLISSRIAAEAKGGTLVLMTGFDRANLLFETLFPLLGDRLIQQTRTDKNVVQCRAEFMEMARAGLRPVWIGTGSAGTGLDLRDDLVPGDQASKDLILTDLVIPALPFGINRTITHASRVSFGGFSVEKAEALSRFLQWIGRLVRREGLEHRRLWVTDGRLVRPKDVNWTSDFMHVLKGFEKHVEL